MVEKDLYWFNPVDKIMYHGVGSRLEFIYNKEHHISFPKVIKEEEEVFGNSLPNITKWVSHNKDKFDLEINSGKRNVVIDFNIQNWNDIISSLTENKINFEYDERQFKKEVRDFEKSLKGNKNAKSRNR